MRAVRAHTLVHAHTAGSLPAQPGPVSPHSSKQVASTRQVGGKCGRGGGEWGVNTDQLSVFAHHTTLPLTQCLTGGCIFAAQKHHSCIAYAAATSVRAMGRVAPCTLFSREIGWGAEQMINHPIATRPQSHRPSV